MVKEMAEETAPAPKFEGRFKRIYPNVLALIDSPTEVDQWHPSNSYMS